MSVNGCVESPFGFLPAGLRMATGARGILAMGRPAR